MTALMRRFVLVAAMVCCLAFGFVCGDYNRTKIDNARIVLGDRCFTITQVSPETR